MSFRARSVPSLVFALLVFANFAGCSTTEETDLVRPVLPDTALEYRSQTAPIFGIEFPSDEEAPFYDERAQLGRVLFHDRMLSQNGAVSCNSCHLQSHGFAEPKALSKGLRSELTERNASHLANPGAQHVYFWDGRANDLTTQVTMPVENHVEMGFRSLEDLANRLNQLDYYAPPFRICFWRPNTQCGTNSGRIVDFPPVHGFLLLSCRRSLCVGHARILESLGRLGWIHHVGWHEFDGTSRV